MAAVSQAGQGHFQGDFIQLTPIAAVIWSLVLFAFTIMGLIMVMCVRMGDWPIFRKLRKEVLDLPKINRRGSFRDPRRYVHLL